MPQRSVLFALALAPFIAVAPAFAQQAPATPHSAAAPPMPGMASAPANSPAGQAMMSSMQRMDQGMAAAGMTGDPDRDFVAMMIPHHQGAIDMAEVELKYGKDPAMRRLAQSIVTAQRREIAEMKRWQASHR